MDLYSGPVLKFSNAVASAGGGSWAPAQNMTWRRDGYDDDKATGAGDEEKEEVPGRPFETGREIY